MYVKSEVKTVSINDLLQYVLVSKVHTSRKLLEKLEKGFFECMHIRWLKIINVVDSSLAT